MSPGAGLPLSLLHSVFGEQVLVQSGAPCNLRRDFTSTTPIPNLKTTAVFCIISQRESVDLCIVACSDNLITQYWPKIVQVLKQVPFSWEYTKM